jgi:hypothetical protein
LLTPSSRYHAVGNVSEGCFAYVWEHIEWQMLGAFNFSLAGIGVRSQLLLSTNRDREGPIDLPTFPLRADEGCLVELLEKWIESTGGA